MRDINCETIEFKNCVSFLALGDELWDGALERWKEADEATRSAVWDRVKDYVESTDEVVDITQINDIIWFECDDLFFPPTFRVEVWTLKEDGARVYMIDSERFDGPNAESELEDWVYDRFHNVDYENVLRVIKINESSGYEEDL